MVSWGSFWATLAVSMVGAGSLIACTSDPQPRQADDGAHTSASSADTVDPCSESSQASPVITLGCSTNPCRPDSTLTAAYYRMPGCDLDRVVLVPQGEPSQALTQYRYTNGGYSGSQQFSGLPDGAHFVARALVNGTWTQIGSDSNAVFITSGAPAATLGASCSDTPCTTRSSITVSFTNLPGSEHDWVGLFPEGASSLAYVKRAYTAGAHEGSITFNDLPADTKLVARVFADDTYAKIAPDTEAIEVKTVHPTVHASCSASPCTSSDTVTVTFASLPGNATDWIALVRPGTSMTYVQYKYTGGTTSGSVTFTDLPPGADLVARAFENNTWNQVGPDSEVVSIAASTAGPSISLACSASPCTPADTVTATFANYPGNVYDWVAIVPVGAPTSSFAQYKYTGGAVNGSVSFTGLPAGSFVARGLENNTYTAIGADSAPLTITPGEGASPTITATCNADPCVAGSDVTVAYNHMPTNAAAWIAIAASSDPDTTDLQWAYTGGSASGSKVFGNIPAGSFVARAFADNGFVKVAESAPVVVTTGP